MEILDDGALRSVTQAGEPVDRVLPGCQQPIGDAGQLPDGEFEECWRGERMDLGLAVDLLLRKSRGALDVPAGTHVPA